MPSSETVTPIYGGYHPADTAYQWLATQAVDSPAVVGFFNELSGRMAPRVHAVQRCDLLFRTSDAGFSIQAIVHPGGARGLVMVLKAWSLRASEYAGTPASDVAHAEIHEDTVKLLSTGDKVADTVTWLTASMAALQSLLEGAGVQGVALPDIDELLTGVTITPNTAGPASEVEYPPYEG